MSNLEHSKIQIYKPGDRINKLISGEAKHSNTDRFREAALHFLEFGKYTSDYPNSNAYKAFWKEETRRCLFGFHAGHDWIPGYYYYYLNYSPILKSIELDGSDFDIEGQIQGERLEGFPDFWDGDYLYFNYLDEAEKSGKHGVVLKTRGRGYSFKGGSMMTRNFFLIPKSKSYAIASQMEFLTKDGLLSKAWDVMSFIDTNTAWSKAKDVKNGDTHRKASAMREVNGVWTEQGIMSEIIGVSLNDNPNKARGKRGKLILWEEAGEFPKLLKAWTVARPSVEQGRITHGLMIAFGTGGSEESDFSGLEELFYNPKAHNILAVNNVWDEGKMDTDCGFFMPEYMNMSGYMDADGNSDREGATKVLLTARAEMRENTNDPNIYMAAVAEKPTTPKEALQKTTGNLFPVAELDAVERYMTNNEKLKFLGVHVNLLRDPKSRLLYTELNPKAAPLNKYPTPKGIDRTGTVTIYHQPHREPNGKIKNNLYYAVCDPYGLNTKGGQSLGVVWIICAPNNFTNHPDDCIVASYIGRPRTQDQWNRICMDLCEYYNALLTPENDRGNIVDYCIQHKKLHQLQEEFGVKTSKNTVMNNLGRGYGVSMGNRQIKLQAIEYLNKWLLKPRGKDKLGRELYNLHYLPDISLVQELIKYDLDGNFDRVSALLIAPLIRMHNFEKVIDTGKEKVTNKFKKLFKR